MKVYISGPITGHADLNRPAFERAVKLLEALGHKAISPFDNGLPACASWFDHMRADIRQLTWCDGVAYLPGWDQSKGAQIEVRLAAELGLTTDSLAGWLLEADLPDTATEVDA